MEKSSFLRAPRQPETAVPQQASSRSLRLFNGSIHWISAVVLLYAFISNGESNRAMNSSVAMKGEVKVGVVVGLIFFIRFIWASSRLSAGGRWTIAFAPTSSSNLRLLMNLGIYLGVAASVISGLLIAYLRPGARVIPHTRGLTDRSSLNGAIFTCIRHSCPGMAMRFPRRLLCVAGDSEEDTLGTSCGGLA